jgi:hypothetical protein
MWKTLHELLHNISRVNRVANRIPIAASVVTAVSYYYGLRLLYDYVSVLVTAIGLGASSLASSYKNLGTLIDNVNQEQQLRTTQDLLNAYLSQTGEEDGYLGAPPSIIGSPLQQQLTQTDVAGAAALPPLRLHGMNRYSRSATVVIV